MTVVPGFNSVHRGFPIAAGVTAPVEHQLKVADDGRVIAAYIGERAADRAPRVR